MWLLPLVFSVLIGAVAGAVILQISIAIFNGLARVGGDDKDNQVPELEFGQAITFSFLAMLMNFGLGFLMSVILGLIVVVAHDDSVYNAVMLLPRVLAWPMSIMLTIFLLMKSMPTDLPRAFLISLISTVIGVFLIALLGCGAVVLGVFAVR